MSEMAECTGVSAHTLRYYERVGLIHPIARSTGNQRRYAATDVDWVQFLLRLRETGMPISTMRTYAELRAQGDTTVAARLELLLQHQAELHARMTLLRAHDHALTTKIATYRTMLEDTHD